MPTVPKGGVEAPPKDNTLPDANQYKYQKDELAAFCHFGPNTFNDVEWGENYGTRTADDIFRLTEDFDAETLVRTIYNAGFKKLIVTAKHHDGFCIWQSDYTDYDIESTKYWRDREQKRKETNSEVYGDVLAEISAACTKYNIDMGLYLSPWDVHDPSYGYYDADGKAITDENKRDQDVLDYNEYYNNQLIEILGNDIYGNAGHFVEVWMDGANGGSAAHPELGQEYDFDTWFTTIQTHEGTLNQEKNYEADCLLYGAGDRSTVRWIGNERGEAAETTWSKSKVLPDTYNNEAHIFNDPSQSTDIINKKDGTKNTGYYKGDPTDGYSNGYETGNHWTVPEVDAKTTTGWFWRSEKSWHTPISLDSLANMYFNSVGRGGVLLLNIPPNTEGKIEEEIVDRIEEFGDNIRETFRTNLAASEDATIYASSVYKNNVAYKPGNVVDGDDATYWTVDENTKQGSLIVKWEKAKTFDVVSLEEAIQNGQRINSYKVEYKANDNAEWTTLESGVTVGSKRLVRFSPISATQVKITVGIGDYPLADETTLTSVPANIRPEADVTPRIPMLSEIGIYKATDAFATGTALPDGMEMIVCNDSKITYSEKANWNSQQGADYLNGQNTWSTTQNASFEFTFTGSKIYLMGTKDTGHGKGDVYIDDQLVSTIDTCAASRATGTLIYESEDLEHKEHTIKVVVKDAYVAGNNKNAIGFEAAYIINNGGKGLLELEKAAYTTHEGCDVAVKVKRVGGSTGELKATLLSDVGSAIQRHFDTGLTTELTFADGETVKYIPAAAKTYRNTQTDGNVYFFIKLSGDYLGMQSSAKVTIQDTEGITDESFADFVEKCAEYTISTYNEEGWAAFKTARSSAKAVAEDANATLEQKQAAYIALDEALAKLTKRTGFTEKEPFPFPAVVNETEVLEAELGIIENKTEGDGGWPMQITNATWGEKSVAFVNAMNNNDSLKIPYDAAEAGTYEVVITYRSGNASNGITWESDPEGSITGGSKTAGASDDAKNTHTATFTMEITEAGKGTLIFHGAETYGAPQIDKFDITLKKANVDFTKLQELIESIDTQVYEGKKTQGSILVLKTAIEEAKALYADETAIAAATQTKTNAAKAAIEEALEALVDLTGLKEAIEAAKEALKEESRYTAESVEALKKALEGAETLLEKADASGEEVAAAVEALAAAKAGLAEPSAPENNNGGNGNSSSNGSGSSSGNQNDQQEAGTYEILEGKDSKYVSGSGAVLTIRANGVLEKFECVKVDGKTVDSKYYEVKSGSTIVTFKEEFLKLLSVGEHTIEVVFEDGTAKTSLTIAENTANTDSKPAEDPASGNTSNPGQSQNAQAAAQTSTGTGAKTGDSANTGIWVVILAAAAVAAGALVVLKRKNKAQQAEDTKPETPDKEA